MNEWQLQLAPRWEALRVQGSRLGWNTDDSPFLHELATKAGVSWYDTRTSDRVGDFMRYDATMLFRGLPGFGRIKCQRLIQVLESALNAVQEPPLKEESPTHSSSITCEDALRRWGVPMDYPLNLLPVSTRLINFCKEQTITSLPRLLAVWNTIGRTGLLAHANIGRRTVDEIEALVNAIARADVNAIRHWLPINDAENGLCVRRALGVAHSRRSETELAIVKRRIVDGLTLEEVGSERGITRERVRQLEVGYLRDVESMLKAFEAESAKALDLWTVGGNWQQAFLPQSSTEADELLLSAIEACFSETPQGVARRLAAESRMESWVEAAMIHPELHLGGFDLQEFLELSVPTGLHDSFIAELTSKPAVVVDYASGLVKPTSPCVRDTVNALLAQEEEPIPLTWLTRRVQSIEGCEEGDSDFIMRNRYRWSQSGHLDLSKVIWDQ